jgi:hypothetical protein
LTAMGAAALVLTVAGCGDKNDASGGTPNTDSTVSTTVAETTAPETTAPTTTSETTQPAETTAPPTTAAPTTEPPTTEPPTSEAATSAAGGGSAATYQDGKVYAIKQGVSVKIAFSYDKPEGPYTVALQSVQKASLSDFSDYKLDAQVKASDIYYVTLSYTNTGTAAKQYPNFNAMVSAYDKDDSEGTSLITGAKVGTCDTNGPDESTPGKTFTQCKIIVMPKGDAITTVGFDADLKNDVEVVWKAS